MQVESTNINTNELNKIKEGLINQYKSDSDNSDSSSEFSANSESDKSTTKSKKSKKSDKTISIYKVRLDKLEQRVHYMKLDIVNKDIEIEELKIKVINHDKNELLFKNIHFLFDRLDNAITVLNDKINNRQENPDYIKELVFLETNKELCLKTEEKYKNYLNNDVCPLFNNKKYINDSVIQLYNMKNIEMIKIHTNIENKINTIKDKLNKRSDDYSFHYLICCIAFFIAFVYYYFK
jgi:hypothetical protein